MCIDIYIYILIRYDQTISDLGTDWNWNCEFSATAQMWMNATEKMKKWIECVNYEIYIIVIIIFTWTWKITQTPSGLKANSLALRLSFVKASPILQL